MTTNSGALDGTAVGSSPTRPTAFDFDLAAGGTNSQGGVPGFALVSVS